MQREKYQKNDVNGTVLLRTLNEEEDKIDYLLLFSLYDLPSGIEKEKVKQILEQAGLLSGDQWKNVRIYLEGDQVPSDVKSDLWEYGNTEFASYEDFSYAELLDMTKEEKRVTLRMPRGLHSALTAKAQQISFNQLCINLLSQSIGYSLEDGGTTE